jgi:hypothetical protein
VGLLGDMFKGVRMKEPVRGQAQVVSCSGYRGDGVFQNCRMQLVVSADGVPPTAVQHNELVNRNRWPTPGMPLPVTVDRSNPQKLKIEWDEVESSRDRGARNAEAMAAAMRGEGGAPLGALGAANVNVVNLGGRDLSQLSEEQKAKLRMLGIDPPPAAAADEVDERLARLEKLGRLKQQGLLTEAEFEEQKRRILAS